MRVLESKHFPDATLTSKNGLAADTSDLPFSSGPSTMSTASSASDEAI